MSDKLPLIEKNIPIPPHYSGDKWRVLLSKMEVGDSFLIEYSDANQRLMLVIAQQLNLVITTRKVPEGLRVWRVSKRVKRKW